RLAAANFRSTGRDIGAEGGGHHDDRLQRAEQRSLVAAGRTVAPKFISKIDKCLISFRPNGQKCYNKDAVSWVLAG
ncbi:hypothetical protein, partial [Roseinatronobacter alkalisoli]